MTDVKLGLIGVGNMGRGHCRTLQKIRGLELTAVCDIVPERMDLAVELHDAATYADPHALMAESGVEAVIIATPHYDHTTLGIAALEAGLHVMVEKPISVHKADCERLIAAHTRPEQVFAAMFNQRTNQHYLRIKSMIDGGELGAVRRMNWVITDWFRTASYYASGGWRATWGGEGGGVLLNQCPHQLDLLQWLFGMPESVTAFCALGKTHDIEVEDEVTAYLTWPGGATGVFVTTTGEAPGINRLEIAGDNGLLVFDASGQTLTFQRNVKPVPQALAENGPFQKPKTEAITIDFRDEGRQHHDILVNFRDAIRDGTPLIAPAAEGIRSVELGNAMLMSGLSGARVTMPLDGALYESHLETLIANSTHKKAVEEHVADDMSASF